MRAQRRCIFSSLTSRFALDCRRDKSSAVAIMSKKQELSIIEAPAYASEGEKVYGGSTVPEQYRGTYTAQHDMAMLGKKQVLRRNFKLVTMLGFASTVMVAWEILPVISVYALTDGGTAIIFLGLVAGLLGMSCVYASLAEMASMCPTAGGQYH